MNNARHRRPLRNRSVYQFQEPQAPSTFKIKPLYFKLGAVALILAALAWGIFFSSIFAIRRVIVSGSQDPALIERTRVFEGKNIWRVTTSAIETGIIQDFTQIASVTISRGIPDTIKLEVHERPVALVWVAGTQLAFSDNGGIISKVIPTTELSPPSEGDQFTALRVAIPENLSATPLVWDTHGAPVDVRNFRLPLVFVAFVLEARQALQEEFQLPVKFFLVRETTLQIEAVTERGWRILFDTTRPFAAQRLGLRTVLDTRAADVRSYIDLRVDGWAYFK